MNGKIVPRLAPFLVLALIGAGCGKQVVDKSVDDVINSAANANAAVNINTNTTPITNTSVKVGTVVPLPTNFPKDIYVIDGTIRSAVATSGVGFTVGLTTTKTPAEAKALYDQKLPTDSWSITTSAVIDVHSSVVMAKKGVRTVSVAISDTDGPTIVTITEIEKNTTTGAGDLLSPQ